MKRLLPFLLFLAPAIAFAQKKPLDHTVYDAWESFGERLISNDGRWVVYTITPQEGDADLWVQAVDSSTPARRIPRGYSALFTEDSRFLLFRIRPQYRETREARIKKKKPEDFPKDSIGILQLKSGELQKMAKVRSFKTPQQAFGWVAILKEKDPVPARAAASPTQRTVDSLRRTIDSLVLLVTQVKNVKAGNADETDADEEPSGSANAAEGADLVVRNLLTGKDRTFKNVADYQFSKNGNKLVMKVVRGPRDSTAASAVLVFNLAASRVDTILKGGNDFRNFAISDDGSRIAFLAERDTNTKALQKFYGLYLYRDGDDSAFLLADKHHDGMLVGQTISENGLLSFSRNGNRLFFGTAPIQPARDTSLVDIDLVKLDIWHYKDDYLQTQQLLQLPMESRRSYLAVFDLGKHRLLQLGSKGLPTVVQTAQGDGDYFYAVTDTGRRVESQWSGPTKKDLYQVDLRTGERTLIKKNHDGQIYPSSTGKYLLLYDQRSRHYHAWDGKRLANITSRIKWPLYNEENDTPDEPNPYGVMGWHEKDSFVYVYDRFDVWKVDPSGVQPPQNFTANGRTAKESYRYVQLDEEERFFRNGQELVFRKQHADSKENGWSAGRLQSTGFRPDIGNGMDEWAFSGFAKARDADVYCFTRERFEVSPVMEVIRASVAASGKRDYTRLHSVSTNVKGMQE